MKAEDLEKSVAEGDDDGFFLSPFKVICQVELKVNYQSVFILEQRKLIQIEGGFQNCPI
jgi:hypothetical protein